MNWTLLTADDLKAVGHGTIIDRARTAATGSVDPVDEEIANAVARVRRAVASGHKLDANAAKVPNSLKALTMRMAVFALMERIRYPLSRDQETTRKEDYSDLLRIADRKSQVEVPDEPMEVSSIPQNRGAWNSERKIIGRMHAVPAPGRQFPPGHYANPDAPLDAV